MALGPVIFRFRVLSDNVARLLNQQHQAMDNVLPAHLFAPVGLESKQDMKPSGVWIAEYRQEIDLTSYRWFCY